MRLRLQPVIALLLAVPALALGACGNDDPTSAAQPSVDQAPAASPGPSLEHIHGLGVDPRTRALYVASHTGIFRAEDGETQVERVGESQQDTMGFSLVSSDRFLGSGHPDPRRTDQPSSLGLIESRDGGRTWTNISLAGQADFHVLRAAGSRVYGVNSADGALMVSSDAGRSWTTRTAPAPPFDLAIDPRDPDRVLAATEQGLYLSADGGADWRPVNQRLAGLLAWPDAERMFLIDAVGQVLSSDDEGQSFTPAGQLGEQPVAFLAEGDELYAALADGTVKRSVDGGASWTVRAQP